NTAKMEFLYRQDWPTFNAMVQERRKHPFRFEEVVDALSAHMTWFHHVVIKGFPNPQIRITWIGVLAASGFMIALVSGRGIQSVLLVLPALFHHTFVFAIGDSLPRYTLPVDWIGWVLIAITLDCFMHLATTGFSTIKLRVHPSRLVNQISAS